jgi:hypothetical protein
MIVALICSAIVPLASVSAASRGATAGQPSAAQAATPLKAVIVVGPTHSSTSRYLGFGESLAQLAESYGMDVRRIFHPNATAARLKTAIQGANLVAYFGHGNGWPSPYAPFQEKTKNGMGLNPYEGGSQNTVEYYGGNWFRNNAVLAENAVVLFGGLCYAEGNGEPGMGIPGWDVARQRVDNFASAFLEIGAGAVYAYGWQSVNIVLDKLMTTDKTVDEIFMIPGKTGSPSSGFIDWDDRYFDSQRVPGLRNHLDPHPQEGFLRAVTGRLGMTGADFRNGEPPSGGGDPDPEPTNQPPSVPQGVTAVPQPNGSVLVSWQPSTDDQTGAVRYRVFRNGYKVGTLSTNTSYTDWPKPGTHSYKVRAVDASGLTSAFSSTVWANVTGSADTVAPQAPEWMTATSLGERRVEVAWAAAVDNSSTSLKYQLWRGNTLLTTTTALSYVDRPASTGVKTYWVRAIDAAGNKGAWASVQGVAVE